MKFFLIVGFLATACFADLGKHEVVDLSDAQKEGLMYGVIKDLEAYTDKKCMEKLKRNLLNTATKYMTKVINGKPFFKQDGKERSLRSFIGHSKFYRTKASAECKRSLIRSLDKAYRIGHRPVDCFT